MEEKGFAFYCPSSERKRRKRDEYEAAASEMHSLWKKNKVKRSKHTRYNDASMERGIIREVIELPNEDLLEEIMLKFPVKTLIRFQIVSKQWKRMITRMITSKYFTEKYMLHVKTKGPKFLSAFEDKTRYKPTITLKTVRLDWSSTSLVEEEKYNIIYEEEVEDEYEDEDEVWMVSKSLDGLFCVHSSIDWSRQIKIVNTARRCSYKIPLAEIQIRCYYAKNYFPPLGFGKDYVTGTYKLVWLHSIFKNILSCEVFDFGVKQWRNVDPPSPLLLDHRLENEKLPTFANGWIYWLLQDKTKLIAFDLHMEVFKLIPNPIIEAASSLPSSIYNDIRIDSMDGHHFVWLSFSTYGDDSMQHVWKLSNHNTGGAFSIVNKVFSFNYVNITSRRDFVAPKLFNIQPISKNANKFLLSGRNNEHLLLLQPLNSSSFVMSDFPFPPRHTLIPFFPSLVSPL